MNNIITLKDASGNDVEFKMLDQFTHDKRTYVVLMPHLIKQILSLKYSKKETKTNLIL